MIWLPIAGNGRGFDWASGLRPQASALGLGTALLLTNLASPPAFSPESTAVYLHIFLLQIEPNAMVSPIQRGCQDGEIWLYLSRPQWH